MATPSGNAEADKSATVARANCRWSVEIPESTANIPLASMIEPRYLNRDNTIVNFAQQGIEQSHSGVYVNRQQKIERACCAQRVAGACNAPLVSLVLSGLPGNDTAAMLYGKDPAADGAEVRRYGGVARGSSDWQGF